MGILKTFIIISVYGEIFIGSATKTFFEKGNVVLENVGMLCVRIKIPKWGVKEISPIGKNFKRYSSLSERVRWQKKMKNCIRYSLTNGEELLVFT